MSWVQQKCNNAVSNVNKSNKHIDRGNNSEGGKMKLRQISLPGGAAAVPSLQIEHAFM